ncbi:unnamed protein product, partial [Rotaria sordida]
MGLIHEKNGNYDKALICYKQALNVQSAAKSEIATLHNSLGFLYYRRGDYGDAREHLMTATQLIDDSHRNW